ncbi:MAG: hypothetical protein PSN44_06285, partial [Gammaproteobacteria bacterium]|nr:hypothetical protein [Gammaproteobacteria bacterium]
LDRQIAITSLIIAILAFLWALFSQFKDLETNLMCGSAVVILGLIARAKLKHHRKLLEQLEKA